MTFLSRIFFIALLFYSSDFLWLASFRALLESSADKAALIQKVNKFAEEQTEGKIKNLLKEVKTETALGTLIIFFVDHHFPVVVLVNAVYFKAKFEDEFDPIFTRQTPFFLLDGKSVKCQMMCYMKPIEYQDRKEFQAVKLNYKDRSTNLQIFLPTEKGPKVCFISRIFVDIVIELRWTLSIWIVTLMLLRILAILGHRKDTCWNCFRTKRFDFLYSPTSQSLLAKIPNWVRHWSRGLFEWIRNQRGTDHFLFCSHFPK